MTIRGLATWATLCFAMLLGGCGAGSGRSGTDLTVSGIGPSATLNGGDTAVFLMTVANRGDYSADDVTIRNVLSQLSQSSLSIVCTARDGATCPDPVGSTMTVSSIPSGGSLDFQISATSIAGASGTVGDTLSVSADSTDTDGSNNTLTISTPIVSNDVSVTATAPPGPLVNGPATFTMLISNAGPNDATNVVLTTTASANVAFKPGDIACVANPNIDTTVTTLAVVPTLQADGTLLSPLIPSSGGLTCTVPVTVADATNGFAVVTVTASAVGDSRTGNNAGTGTVSATLTNDLSVTALAPTGPLVNGAATFTMTIDNAGPSTATSVVITNTLSSALSLAGTIDCVASGGAATPTPQADGTLISASIPPTGQIVCTVPTLAAAGTNGLISDTLSVSAANDPKPSNNTATGVVSATLVYDLSVTVAAPAGPLVSGAATFTTTVSNAGPSTATSVTITNTLSAALAPSAPITCTSSGGATAPTLQNDGTLLAASMPPSSQIVCTVPTTVSSGTNGVVSVTSSVLALNDPTPGNNTATGTVGATLVNDLSVTAVAPAGPLVSNAAVFKMTIDNAGPSTATSVVITNTLSPSLALSAPIACSATGGATVPELQPDGTLLATSIPPLGQIVCSVSTVVATGTNGLVSDTLSVSPVNDQKTGNNTATAIISATLVNDVGVSVAAPAGPLVNRAASFTTTIVNNGPATATSVALTNTLSTALTLSAPIVCTASDGAAVPTLQSDGTLLAATMAPASRIVCTVPTTVAGGTNAAVSNTATVRTANDPNASNNTATGTVGATLVNDLSVVATAPAGPLLGPAATFTMTIGNAGPATATSVVITNTLGPLLTLNGSISCVPSGGATTPTPQTDGTFLVASVPPSSTIVCSIPTLAAAGTNAIVSDTLSVAAANDPNTVNNAATANVGVTLVNDLSVAVTAPVGPLVSGAATFTATIGNAGPATATSVVISNTVGPLLTLNGAISCVASNGATTPVSQRDGTLLVASVPPSSKIVCSIPTLAAPGTNAIVSDTVSVAAVNDSNTVNNSATGNVGVTLVNDLSAAVSVPAGPLVNGTTTFTATIGNAGPATATSVVIANTLSTALTLNGSITCVTTGGATAPTRQSNGTLLAATMPSSSQIVCSVPTTVAAGTSGLVSDTVSVTAANDPSPANNSAVASVNATLTNNVSVTAGPAAASVLGGGTTTFTFVVGNSGPSTAFNVTLTNALSANLTLTSPASCVAAGGASAPVAASGGALVSASLPVGGTLNCSVPVIVTAGANGTVNSTFTATAANDQLAANNSATAATLAVSSDLGVSETVASLVAPGNKVAAGKPVTFAAVVANPRGQGTATNVNIRLTPTLPSTGQGITFSVPTCSATGGGICPTVLGTSMTVPSLLQGATLTFSYTATTTASDRGALSNMVAVTADSDPNLSNNSATATVTVVDSRNDTYTVFAANGLGYNFTVDFDAGSYTMEGQGQSVQHNFTVDPVTGDYAVSSNVRFRVAQDLVVGGHDFTAGVLPYVAARSFQTNVAQIAGSYNLASRNVASSLATTHAGTALISQNTLSVCQSDAIQVAVARNCDPSALKVYNLTTDGNQGFIGTTSSNEVYAFSVANVGAARVLISTGVAPDSTQQFRIGLIDSTGGLTFGQVRGASITPTASNISDWVQITLTNPVVNGTPTPFYASASTTTTDTDSASLRTFGPTGAGPFSMLTGTSALYNAPLYVMQASPLIVVIGGSGFGGAAAASGLMQIGLP